MLLKLFYLSIRDWVFSKLARRFNSIPFFQKNRKLLIELAALREIIEEYKDLQKYIQKLVGHV